MGGDTETEDEVDTAMWVIKSWPWSWFACGIFCCAHLAVACVNLAWCKACFCLSPSSFFFFLSSCFFRFVACCFSVSVACVMLAWCKACFCFSPSSFFFFLPSCFFRFVTCCSSVSVACVILAWCTCKACFCLRPSSFFFSFFCFSIFNLCFINSVLSAENICIIM